MSGLPPAVPGFDPPPAAAAPLVSSADDADDVGVQAAAVAAAVRSCAHVVDLSGGSLGEFATYLPGDRVAGVRIGADVIDVHIVAALAAPSLPAVADEVRSAVRPLASGRAVNVFIEDVDDAAPAAQAELPA